MLASLVLAPPKAALACVLGAATAFAGWVFGPAEFRLATVLMAFALSWASIVDFDRFILPDVLTLGLLVVGLALSAIAGRDALLHHLIGAAAGYASLVLMATVYRRLRGREGLGRGDAKLLGAAGAWLGWAGLPAVLLIGSTGAIAWILVMAGIRRSMDRHEAIAFGPFIALGFWLVWLFGAGTTFPYDTMSAH